MDGLNLAGSKELVHEAAANAEAPGGLDDRQQDAVIGLHAHVDDVLLHGRLPTATTARSSYADELRGCGHLRTSSFVLGCQRSSLPIDRLMTGCLTSALTALYIAMTPQ